MEPEALKKMLKELNLAFCSIELLHKKAATMEDWHIREKLRMIKNDIENCLKLAGER